MSRRGAGAAPTDVGRRASGVGRRVAGGVRVVRDAPGRSAAHSGDPQRVPATGREYSRLFRSRASHRSALPAARCRASRPGKRPCLPVPESRPERERWSGGPGERPRSGLRLRSLRHRRGVRGDPGGPDRGRLRRARRGGRGALPRGHLRQRRVHSEEALRLRLPLRGGLRGRGRVRVARVRGGDGAGGRLGSCRLRLADPRREQGPRDSSA